MVNRILGVAGVPEVKKSISPGMAYAAGWVLEKVHGLLGLKGEPRMTRFLARELSTAHWFDISAAKKDLNYQPAISMDEGMERLREWLDGQG
jgi:nucleoside-diphosphate-sugar epimerase